MRSLICALLCLAFHSAYAVEKDMDYPTIDPANQKCIDISDPLEGLNRKIFMFNSVLDHFLLRPVAKGYTNMFSDVSRARVSNAVTNIQMPLTTVNNVLQGKGHNALLSFWQFAVNATFGIGGLENVAKKTGLQTEVQTFGNTLASYGVGPGPYIVLPFLGGTNTRDMGDSVVFNSLLNPLKHKLSTKTKYAITGVKLVSDRANILPFTDNVAKTSTDPYITIRSAIHQNREKNVQYPSYYKCRRD